MTKVILGYTQMVYGEQLIINTTTDELIKMHIKDREERWDLYCNHVKITVEKLTKKEFNKELKNMENKEKETYENQMRDSDIIFTAISTSGAKNFEEANRMITMAYIMDLSVSRSGISHALGRLEKYYKNLINKDS